MSTRFPIVKQSRLFERIFYDPLFLIHTLTIRKQISNLLIKKSVHHEIYKHVCDNLPPNSTKKFIFQNFQNKNTTSPISLHLFYKLKTAYTNGSLQIYDLLKQYYLSSLKIFPDRPLILPQD